MRVLVVVVLIMAYNEISIGTLEKNARRLAKSLEELGLKIEVTVFRTGPGGGQHFGPSYVELEVEGTYTNEENETEEVSSWVKFVAGGYATTGRNQFGNGDTWTVMSKAAREYLMKDLKAQGWSPAT